MGVFIFHPLFPSVTMRVSLILGFLESEVFFVVVVFCCSVERCCRFVEGRRSGQTSRKIVFGYLHVSRSQKRRH